eukprot:329256-Chlamydomonas_euryale.AAC.1
MARHRTQPPGACRLPPPLPPARRSNWGGQRGPPSCWGGRAVLLALLFVLSQSVPHKRWWHGFASLLSSYHVVCRRGCRQGGPQRMLQGALSVPRAYHVKLECSWPLLAHAVWHLVMWPHGCETCAAAEADQHSANRRDDGDGRRSMPVQISTVSRGIVQRARGSAGPMERSACRLTRRAARSATKQERSGVAVARRIDRPASVPGLGPVSRLSASHGPDPIRKSPKSRQNKRGCGRPTQPAFRPSRHLSPRLRRARALSVASAHSLFRTTCDAAQPPVDGSPRSASPPRRPAHACTGGCLAWAGKGGVLGRGWPSSAKQILLAVCV